MSRLAYIALLALIAAACDQQQMTDQPKYEPYEAASGWPHDQSARQPPAGTVARDEPLEPAPQALPVPLTRELLAQGRRRYETYCAVCHGETGYGDGIVVQRGFPAPPPFHSERLRKTSLSHFYTVISDGYGIMYAYADRVTREDRWAIAAYIRALQLSQHAKVEDLSPEQRARLEGQR